MMVSDIADEAEQLRAIERAPVHSTVRGDVRLRFKRRCDRAFGVCGVQEGQLCRSHFIVIPLREATLRDLHWVYHGDWATDGERRQAGIELDFRRLGDRE